MAYKRSEGRIFLRKGGFSFRKEDFPMFSGRTGVFVAILKNSAWGRMFFVKKTFEAFFFLSNGVLKRSACLSPLQNRLTFGCWQGGKILVTMAAFFLGVAKRLESQTNNPHDIKRFFLVHYVFHSPVLKHGLRSSEKGRGGDLS